MCYFAILKSKKMELEDLREKRYKGLLFGPQLNALLVEKCLRYYCNLGNRSVLYIETEDGSLVYKTIEIAFEAKYFYRIFFIKNRAIAANACKVYVQQCLEGLYHFSSCVFS